MNLYTDHRPRFIPFNLKVEAAARARSVISGSPPTGVAPLRFDANTRYLGTLGLEEGIDVSIFTTFDYEEQQSPFYFFTGTYKLHSQSSALVQFVVHQQKNAWEDSSPFSNQIPALGFVFGTPGIDPQIPTVQALGDPAIYTDHKVGGVPFFSQLEGDLTAVLDLLHNSHVHLLQLNIPSALTDSLIDGMWPFGESVFHVFAKKVGSSFEFHYMWG